MVVVVVVTLPNEDEGIEIEIEEVEDGVFLTRICPHF